LENATEKTGLLSSVGNHGERETSYGEQLCSNDCVGPTGGRVKGEFCTEKRSFLRSGNEGEGREGGDCNCGSLIITTTEDYRDVGNRNPLASEEPVPLPQPKVIANQRENGKRTKRKRKKVVQIEFFHTPGKRGPDRKMKV